MCNAWNHSPGCNCGWGGGFYGGGNSINTSLNNSLANEIKDAETYPTTCWWCRETVFYHSNGFGDSVLFDSLGSPWQVHSCWKEYWNQERIKRQSEKNSVEDSVILSTSDIEQKNSLIFTGAMNTLNKINILVTERQVASYLGISLDILKESFFHLYYYSCKLGNTYVIRMRRLKN